jgi:hypothetical protein
MMHKIVPGIHLYGRCLARVLGVLLLAGLAPACYSSKGTTYNAPPMLGGAGTLFSENFFPTWPNTSWTGPTLSNATAGMGYVPPVYDAQMDTTGTRPGSASTMPTTSFATGPLTFKVELRYTFPAALTLADTASVQIVDGSATVLAQAVLNAPTGMISFSVGAASAGTAAFSSATFHTLTFQVDASNMGSWKMDAGSASSGLAFGTHTSFLELRADFASGSAVAPSFQFANVIVSSP